MSHNSPTAKHYRRNYILGMINGGVFIIAVMISSIAGWLACGMIEPPSRAR